MSLELAINKELANISVGAHEILSVLQPVCIEIPEGEFISQFKLICSEIGTCFEVVTSQLDLLKPVNTVDTFPEQFSGIRASYQDTFLTSNSQPRIHTENAYESFLELQQTREFSTGYPPLKRAFSRFDTFIDKWITNDAWLCMNIDNLFKRLNQLLNEIDAITQKDPEHGYHVYNSVVTQITVYTGIISAAGIEIINLCQPVKNAVNA